MNKFFSAFLFCLLLNGVKVNAFEFNNPDVDGESNAYLTELFSGIADNYSCALPSNVIKFPRDTGLEGCVRKYIGNNRWPMICKAAAEIDTIACGNEPISSLEGLQQFPNLRKLSFDLKGTQIEDLSPIRNLTKMESLSIPNSNISSTAFLSQMEKLSYLNLSGNKITDLKFMPYLKNLENLSLEYQGPDYITNAAPLASLRGLRNLSLQGNKIGDISPLASLANLSALNLRDNRIADISPLSGLSKLSSLNVSINMIEDISPLAAIGGMAYLAANSNRLNSIEAVRNMAALRQISVIGNNISDISPIADKRKIISVSMDYNKVTDLTPIDSIMIYSYLSELGLAYNCISGENAGKVRYISEIRELRLDHQCEEFNPKDALPDNTFVVNGDLVGAENIIDNGTMGANFKTPGSISAGRGCSAGNKGFIDAGYLLLIVLFIKNVFIKKKKGKSI